MSSLLPEDAHLPSALVEAWREDVASEAEVRRAYVRFLRVRTVRPRAPALQIAGWVLIGMFLGIGGVYAASAGPWTSLWRRSVPPAQPTPARELALHRRAPKVASRAPEPPHEPEEPAPALSAAPSSAPNAAAAARPLPSVAASENWQRAARGLRERDFDSASAALLELEAHGDLAERETAQLVRAQLLVSQGRQGEARSLLRALQGSARSPAVREKATALLEQSEKSALSQRSLSTPPATKLP